jgi:hypothetical protein
LASGAGEALAAAARADFVYGNVTVAGLDGREQPLLRGAELNNGDTVHGGGRAQLIHRRRLMCRSSRKRVRDPATTASMARPTAPRRGFFGLLKGAMRAVTGLVG